MKTNQITKSNLKKVFLLLLFFIGLFSFAQQEVFVSGQVIDSDTKENLGYCSISFFNRKEELVKGAITNDKGYFELSLNRGKYKIIIDFMGYQKLEKEVIINKNNQFLGTSKLIFDDKTLDEVTIKANTKSFKVDKNVYSVTKKMKIAAANTNDVLDKISGVTLDRYTNSIKVDGESNVKFLVNGIAKDSEYIQNLNPNRLKKVEIVKGPSGKYGLEGYAAVINIILKQNYKGMELSLFNQAIIDSDANDAKFLLPINNSSLGFNYTYNKINFYSKYSNVQNTLGFPSSIIKEYNDGRTISKTALDNANNLEKYSVNDDAVFGLDYYLNPRNTISFEARFDNVIFNKSDTKINYQFEERNGATLIDSYAILEKMKDKSTNNYQSLFYLSKLNDKDELNIDFTKSYYKGKSTNTFIKDNALDRIDYSENSQNSYKLNAEFNHGINEKSSLNLGYGFNHLKNINQVNTDNFKYEDTRHKLFGYYAFKPSEKVAIKTGIAGEISTPKALGETLTYFIYQPYLDVKYNYSKKVDFKLKYRSNSHYPGLSEANPNTIYIDDQTVSTGNPKLEPSVTHKISVRSNIMHGFLSIEPYYHFSNNYINQFGELRDDGIIEYTYDNVGDYKHYGIKANIAFPLAKSIYWQSNVDYYRSSIEYKGNKNALNDIHFESNIVYVNRKKALTTGIILQRGMNKRITTQGWNKWNNDFVGLLLQKGFYKNKLNLMLLYMLPIDTGLDYKQGEYVEAPTYNSLTTYDINLLKNVIIFKLNYRLSKGKSTRKTKKDIDLEDNNKKSNSPF